MTPRRLFALIAIGGFLFLTVGLGPGRGLTTYPDGVCVSVYASDLPEDTRSLSERRSVLPPVMRCAFIDPAGDRIEKTFVPALDGLVNLIASLLVAGLVAAALWLLQRRQARSETTRVE